METKTATTTDRAWKSKAGTLVPLLFFELDAPAVDVTVPDPALAVPVLSVEELPEF
jgi:hypothetical protein